MCNRYLAPVSRLVDEVSQTHLPLILPGSAFRNLEPRAHIGRPIPRPSSAKWVKTRILPILAMLALGAQAVASSARAASESAVEGWTVSRLNPTACVASGPTDGDAKLSLAAEGPMFAMIVEASDFPKERSSYSAILTFDNKPPVSAAALGDKGILHINVGRGDSAKTVAAASRVTVAVNGRAHNFALPNVAAALDALAHCAAQPTLAEQVDQPPVPIRGAGTWKLMTTLPATPGRVCSARVAGEKIDTMMLLNNDGNLVLIGGHSDWATWGGDVPLKLAIDDGPPIDLTASTVMNLIVVLIRDPALRQRLRSAKTLDWNIPTGHVRGDVSGLGVALDAVKACKAAAEK
ncbi:MAG: hypothetical protein ACREEB_07960 [Caulobacteraceae bacterium]